MRDTYANTRGAMFDIFKLNISLQTKGQCIAAIVNPLRYCTPIVSMYDERIRATLIR